MLLVLIINSLTFLETDFKTCLLGEILDSVMC